MATVQVIITRQLPDGDLEAVSKFRSDIEAAFANDDVRITEIARSGRAITAQVNTIKAAARQETVDAILSGELVVDRITVAPVEAEPIAEGGGGEAVAPG